MALPLHMTQQYAFCFPWLPGLTGVSLPKMFTPHVSLLHLLVVIIAQLLLSEIVSYNPYTQLSCCTFLGGSASLFGVHMAVARIVRFHFIYVVADQLLHSQSQMFLL